MTTPLVPTPGRRPASLVRAVAILALTGVALAGLSGLAAFGLALFLSPPSPAGGVAFPTGPLGRMLTVSGRPVLLKAVPPSFPEGHALRCRWVVEDGGPAIEGKVESRLALSASRPIAPAAGGTTLHGHVDVTDEVTHEVRRGSFEVAVLERTPENLRTVSVDDGLWSLYASQIPGRTSAGQPTTSWKQPWFGATAAAVLAFEVNGHDGRVERAASPYRQTVERGIDALTDALCRVETKPGTFGITYADMQQNYVLPLAVLALVASQQPEAVARTGPPGIVGRTRLELVEEMLAWLAASRGTAKEWQGGWRYHMGREDADLSVTQWPTLAFLSAREVWGLEIPATVRDGLRDGFLPRVHAASGGYGYDGGRTGRFGMTAAALACLRCAGVPDSDARVEEAWKFLASEWQAEGHWGSYQMYGVMKAARLAGREKIGEHDWRREFTLVLAQRQGPDGSWERVGDFDWKTYTTAFSVLTLSTDVFAASHPVTFWDVLRRAAPVVLPAGPLLLLALAARRLLRRRGGAAPAGGSPSLAG